MKKDNSEKAADYCEIGNKYYSGEGVEQNYEKAFYYYNMAAKKGSPEANYRLGICYYHGNGTKQNYKIAFRYFKMAEKQGLFEAQNWLGVCYYLGTGVDKNLKKAVQYFIRAANKGEVDAQFIIGKMYFSGEEVKQDYKQAIKYFNMAADNGHAEAQCFLGMCYYFGQGVRQNYQQAFKYINMAADKGSIDAQYFLGEFYLKGYGTKQNFQKAEEYYRKAFNNGCKSYEYYIRIFDQLQGRKIQVIRDMSEEVEEGAGAVLIVPEVNNYQFSHTLYDIETYRKIKNRINEILEGIEEVKKDKSNEFDVFMKIYIKLAELIHYDQEVNNNYEGIKEYTSRNLVAGLLEGKCVCARICRNIKKCACL